MKTAYLISCSDHYKHRMFAIDAALQAKGYTTTYITSDFDHSSKSVFQCGVPGSVQIHAKPYSKNLSLNRILSHYLFARDVFRYLDHLPQQPDVVVALIPPNFLAFFGKQYKKKHPNVTLVFDIFDMWPETFPSNRAKKLLAPAFGVWAWIRDGSLSAADYVTTECEMFRKLLGLSDDASETVYLCAEPVAEQVPTNLSQEELNLCYLGAINNIIDIDAICALIEKLAKCKPVKLHIVGTGERHQEFVEKAQAAGAQTVFYGAVYEDAKKQEIMAQCHFGLNIMKPSVCVGLTMKSVDYFRNGLPIINSIPGDTKEFVESEYTGIQLDGGCAEKVLSCSAEDCLRMRENVRRMFLSKFSKEVVVGQYHMLLQKLL